VLQAWEDAPRNAAQRRFRAEEGGVAAARRARERWRAGREGRPEGGSSRKPEAALTPAAPSRASREGVGARLPPLSLAGVPERRGSGGILKERVARANSRSSPAQRARG